MQKGRIHNVKGKLVRLVRKRKRKIQNGSKASNVYPRVYFSTYFLDKITFNGGKKRV